ncbi:hypothetical protein EMCG_02903 [[Emmonsia] crescens]|uniref:DUF1754-domain-containing protein n=1 Tax=[Emmonsia] crescens TaxID=73230 RepID=A0A0G2HX02_9EURO|nr:hypothetical protein EMCG_02903 [Emmonsia crescens UAMH 3008]
MAPASEYVSGGGKLKIKGAPVLDGRVGKKGKKKRKKEKEKDKEGGNGSNDEERDGGSTRPRMKSVEGEGESATAAPDGDGGGVGGGGGGGSRSGSRSVSRGVSEGVEKVVVGKTEAERRYEEARRKRLDERLKREGVKTHKERVEELNKYLSNLSEHHDMYVSPPPRGWCILRAHCPTITVPLGILEMPIYLPPNNWLTYISLSFFNHS